MIIFLETKDKGGKSSSQLYMKSKRTNDWTIFGLIRI